MKCRVGIMSVALALVLFSLDSRASDTLSTVKRKAPVGYDAIWSEPGDTVPNH